MEVYSKLFGLRKGRGSYLIDNRFLNLYKHESSTNKSKFFPDTIPISLEFPISEEKTNFIIGVFVTGQPRSPLIFRFFFFRPLTSSKSVPSSLLIL